MITATQEKNVPSPGKQAMIYFDGVIVAHCNEAEWNKFKAEHTNEAILDRVVKIDVPYCLELDQEIKICPSSDYRHHDRLSLHEKTRGNSFKMPHRYCFKK